RAAAGVLAAAVLVASSGNFARAQQLQTLPVAATPDPNAAAPDPVTATTDCKTWMPGRLFGDGECEILKGKLIKAQNACIGEIAKFKKDAPGAFTQMKFGTITRENACEFASRIPKRAADLSR